MGTQFQRGSRCGIRIASQASLAIQNIQYTQLGTRSTRPRRRRRHHRGDPQVPAASL